MISQVQDARVTLRKNDSRLWTREEFEEKLRAEGAAYHDKHVFHRMMIEGRLNRRQLQGWAANRYYYQVSLPLKDAAILSNCPVREIRRGWIERIAFQDGSGGEEGGIEAWLRLCEACGLTREEVVSHRHLLPAVRLAANAYVEFARRAPWQVAVCSSLTEYFASSAQRARIGSWLQHYPWVDPSGLDYFKQYMGRAAKDAQATIDIAMKYLRTRKEQEEVIEAVRFKMDTLWVILDGVYLAYVADLPPPREGRRYDELGSLI
jgi:pyrroloquinoline-quinone synthase